MAKAPLSELAAIVGYRLRALRKVLHLTQEDMGEVAGVGANAISQWESGVRLLSRVAAGRLSDRHGASLDYFFLGRMGGVRSDLAALLAAYSAKVSPPPSEPAFPAGAMPKNVSPIRSKPSRKDRRPSPRRD